MGNFIAALTLNSTVDVASIAGNWSSVRTSANVFDTLTVLDVEKFLAQNAVVGAVRSLLAVVRLAISLVQTVVVATSLAFVVTILGTIFVGNGSAVVTDALIDGASTIFVNMKTVVTRGTRL